MKFRAGEDFFSPIVVKPVLPGLEARNDRVTRSGVMFRCMLIWRTVTAADVTAFSASAKMQPPSAQSHAFGATCSAWLGRWVDTIPLGLHRLLTWAPSPTNGDRPPAPHVHRVRGRRRCFHASCGLAVSDARLALPNFYNIAIRIANIAARLAVFVLWLCDELGSPAFP